MNTSKLRAVIVGTGNGAGISRAHLIGYRYSDDVKVSGIFDLNMDVARAWKEKYNLGEDAVCFENFDQVLDNADIVSICTPNFTHVEMVCRCLERGVNVLCEKPLSNNTEDLEKVRPLLKTTTAKSMINMNYRRIPAFRYLRQLAKSGELGQIYLYRHTMGSSRFANEALPMEWRLVENQSGSGVIGDFCSHMLDMMQFILGPDQCRLHNLAVRKNTFIKERAGKNGRARVENEDCAMILGTLQNGAPVSFMVSRIGAVGNRLEIITSNIIARFSMEEPTKVYIQRRVPGEYFTPEEVVDVPIENPDWHSDTIPPEFVACAENVNEFVQAVKRDTSVPTDLYHGMAIQAEIEELLKVSAI